MRLYELSAEYAELQRVAEDGGDVSDALTRLDGAIEHKAASIFAIERGMKADAQALRNEISRMQDRLRSIDNASAKLREYVVNCLTHAGIERVKGPTFTAYLQRHSRVDVVDEAKVPAEFKRVVTSSCVDKRAVKDAVEKHGEIVPGVEITTTVSLVVK